MPNNASDVATRALNGKDQAGLEIMRQIKPVK